MTTVTPTSTVAPNNRHVTPVTAHPSPPKHSDRSGFNEKAADLIAEFVGSMWMFYASIIGFAIWMAGLRSGWRDWVSRSRATTIRST
jgi:uncharacterized membrane protein